LIHHTNEIAQAEAAFGKILARYWLHGEFLLVEGKKMAKSLGNIYTLEDLIKRGFDPLAYRYLCLGTHYRSKLNFNFDALKSAQNALENLYEKVRELKSTDNKQRATNNGKRYKKEFLEFINDDLDTPKALALMWDLIGDEKISNQEKYKLLLNFDRIFGLNLEKVRRIKIPQKIKKLAKIREEYRKKGDFEKADEIREKIKKMGYWVEDTKEGPRIKKISPQRV
jgi:cysteinyl-tRNA synthetase